MLAGSHALLDACSEAFDLLASLCKCLAFAGSFYLFTLQMLCWFPSSGAVEVLGPKSVLFSLSLVLLLLGRGVCPCPSWAAAQVLSPPFSIHVAPVVACFWYLEACCLSQTYCLQQLIWKAGADFSGCCLLSLLNKYIRASPNRMARNSCA